MNIYLVVIEDRHTDVDVAPFRELEAAERYAEQELHRLARQKEDVNHEELTDPMRADGWKFYATYSTEGDCIMILERELQ